MKRNIIIAFDFSMSKPAMCMKIDENILFYTWPAKVDKITIEKLENSGVVVRNRNIDPINKSKFDSHSLVLEHIVRSNDLVNMIISDISEIMSKYDIVIDRDNIIISSEGLSFASKGDATLNLAAYKQVLLNKLYELGFKNIKTYSPITIKSCAGCAKKSNQSKLSMIDAIKNENPNAHKFIYNLIYNESDLKKKTSYVNTVDDLVDAYWCLKTTIIKEEIATCI